MDYIKVDTDKQLELISPSSSANDDSGWLLIPAFLTGFHNTKTTLEKTRSGKPIYCHWGFLNVSPQERICSCGAKMHINNHPNIYIRHLNMGSCFSTLRLPHNQFFCPKCHATKTQDIPFKAHGHLMTKALYQYIRDLLAFGTYTNKDIGLITGVNENIVKDIDKTRLQELYTTDHGTKLIKPEKPAKYLGIDEFKLHNGRKYATHIIDLENGHILWIQNGKKKQVVYDFIKHVGLEWMDNVEAVACDMNSDFQEAFEELCPHIQPVFDYFHIVKNFNDKVVSEVRKDEQQRLHDEGDDEAAANLKRTRYILTANRKTLQKKDLDAAEGRIIHKGSPLFQTENIVRKAGYEAKYDSLLQENKLLFTLDLVKEKLAAAYKMDDEARMAETIIDIMDICEATGNKHFLWFRKLLDTHFEGVIAHATYLITSGKVEGVNQKIKTLRRHGYGYPDDEYFFLKIMDASRKEYVRHQLSHRICG